MKPIWVSRDKDGMSSIHKAKPTLNDLGNWQSGSNYFYCEWLARALLDGKLPKRGTCVRVGGSDE